MAVAVQMSSKENNQIKNKNDLKLVINENTAAF